MSEAIRRVERILKNSYCVSDYTDLIREIFPTVKIIAPDNFNREFTNFSSHIEGSAHVGNYIDPNGKKVIIHSVQLKKESYVETSRSTQRNYAKRLMEAGNADAAIIAFYTEGDPKWRISFVRLDYELNFENGRMSTVENLTPAKRYSYLVGQDEPCHTAISRFQRFITDEPNALPPTIDDLEEIFSVEKVTEEFFNLYCEKFHQLREALENNPDFVEEAEQHNFTSAQFAKKLMGQIVFLYFLQKKGWLGVGTWSSTITKKQYEKVFYVSGSKGRLIKEYLPQVYVQTGDDEFRLKPLMLDQIPNDAEELIANNLSGHRSWGSGSKKFMRTLFEFSKKKGANFFDDYLEPLFYNALNVNRGEAGYDPELHCRIPFLSGGLFEPIDGYDWKHNDFAIPNEIFSNKDEKGEREADGILDIFDRYNFTMCEDEPLEREVAIDPEMLGKVFENLLEVKDRKTKGAFYTPREIVHYMCQETLISYLIKETGLAEPDIRDFILLGDFMKDEDTSKEKRMGNGGMFISETIYKIDEGGKVVVNRLKDIDAALANIRVADPAVGSGAFPLGMLNEIVRARQNISAYMAITMNGYEKRMMYNNERSPYSLKLQTIKNCIFAADIEPSAVDIAQLRLWLSLVIDDDINPDAQSPLDGHKNPIPLPNLECNILCGNSLIDEFEGVPLINYSGLIGQNNRNQQKDIFQSAYDTILPSLLNAQDQLFRCDDTDKKQELKDVIESLKDELVRVQMQNVTSEQWNRYQKAKEQASRPFVLWQIDFARVFREKGGFDIVIGNPPYVGESGHKELFREVAVTSFGKKYYQGKMDLFYFFFHKALDLAIPNGEVALITTNYFPTATGAKKLRNDFKTRTLIRKFINFNEVKVFESAQGQHNMITFLTKKSIDDIRSVICKTVSCEGSYLATANQIRKILNGEAEALQIANVEQDNLFDGEESYIRLRGVIARSDNTVEVVLNKMSALGSPLSVFAEVNQGVLTGCDTLTNRHLEKLPPDTDCVKNDGIFVLDLTFARDKTVFDGFDSGKRLLKDFYKNSDISRYYSSSKPTKKLIYYTGQLDEDSYPDVYAHMLKFRPILEERLTTYNEHYHWTAIHRPRNGRVFEAGVPKIVVPYRTKTNSFAFNEIEWFCRSDCYVITSKNKGLRIKALLAMLNSDTYFCWLYHRGKRKGEVLELFQKPLSEIPIVLPGDDVQIRLEELANSITEQKQENIDANTDELEEAINQIVYELFGFNEQDIALVKSSVRV